MSSRWTTVVVSGNTSRPLFGSAANDPMTLLIAVSALSMGAGTSSIPRSGAADYCETAGKRSGFFRADFLYAGLGLRPEP